MIKKRHSTTLKFQITIALLLLVLLPVFGVTIVAGNIVFSTVKSEQIKGVGAIANLKYNQLITLLERTNTKSLHLLADINLKCGSKDNFTSCTEKLISEHLLNTGAIGATLYDKDRIITLGNSATKEKSSVIFPPDQLAQLSDFTQNKARNYFVLAVDKQAGRRLAVTFPLEILEAVFTPYPAELGFSGEVFLVDNQGYFVTKQKYPSAAGVNAPLSSASIQSCLEGNSTAMIGVDYRNIPILSGFHSVPEIGGACVSANIEQEEALAPLVLLRQIISLSSFFIAILLIIIIVYLADYLVKPILRLTAIARSIAGGDYTLKADAAGSDEVTDLSNSFNLMTTRLQATIEAAMDAVVQMNSAGMIIGWSGQAEAIFGWCRQEVIGLPLHELIIPIQYRDRHIQGLKRFMSSGKAVILNHRVELSALHRDGHEFPIELTITSIKMSDRYEFSAFMRDITERKKVEQILHDSREELNRLLNSMSEGVCGMNNEGTCTFVNQAFLRMLGYTDESEITGKNIHDTIHHSMLDGSDYPAKDCKIYLAYRDNQLAHVDDEVFWRKDGTPIPVEYWSHPIIANEIIAGSIVTFIDITERKAAEKDIHRLAFYDPLTKLPNRRLLTDRLQQATAVGARSGRYGALLFLDLDHFKIINDTQGHAAGDQVLMEVARRLQACIREGDTIARLGGDEFVVVIEELSRQMDEAVSQTEMIAEKIRLELSRSHILKDREFYSPSSIGICLFCGHQESVDDLLRHADMAMYQSKAQGRNAIRFFDPKMQAVLEVKTNLEFDLQQALDKQQFRLFYQIQTDYQRKPLGAEVLLRWEHPGRGLVMPDDFIRVLEETGLIKTVGLWVLQTACAQLACWQDNPLTRHLTLAVNVSAKQFHQPDFITQVKEVLRKSGIPASLLKLELTESAVLVNVDETTAKMNELKALGINFSMDDFGTGYSSLQYLKRLPLNQIKIDRSFVRDIASDANDAAIVKAIIAMSTALGLDVIAEGVEDKEQMDYLNQHGCHIFQGYLLSKPIPVAQFEQLLKSF